MSRIAYLHIPRFQIVAHQKHEQLKGQPLALDYKLYLSAQKQLIDALISCSPKITAQGFGDFLLDASGLRYMGGESKLCHNVLKLCSRTGFTDAYISIADSAFTAMVAASLKSRRLFIVPSGKDAKFLAPLSIKHLRLDPDIENALLDLGIKSMGQLVNLPVQSLVERFGKNGSIAHALAQGQDDNRATIPRPEIKFECSIDMGGAVSSLNETVFALKAMVDRLTSELKQNGLWAEELLLALYNEDDKFNERLLPLIRPSNQSQFLLQVIKLSLEATPLAREFTRIKLTISRFSKELWQQSFIDTGLDQNKLAPKSSPTKSNKDTLSPPVETITNATDEKLPSSLLTLLQRFLTSIGGNSITKAIASDQYTADNAGIWLPVTQQSASDSVIPINSHYANRTIHGSTPLDWVLRTHPSQVFVELKDNIPSAINYQRQWYRIKCVTRPEYLSVLWWDKPSAKDHYRVLAEPTSTKDASSRVRDMSGLQNMHGVPPAYLMLLTHDKQTDVWHIEGFLD